MKATHIDSHRMSSSIRFKMYYYYMNMYSYCIYVYLRLCGYPLDEWHLCAFNLAKCISLANVSEYCENIAGEQIQFVNAFKIHYFHFSTEIVAMHFYGVLKEECMLTNFRE